MAILINIQKIEPFQYSEVLIYYEINLLDQKINHFYIGVDTKNWLLYFFKSYTEMPFLIKNLKDPSCTIEINWLSPMISSLIILQFIKMLQTGVIKDNLSYQA